MKIVKYSQKKAGQVNASDILGGGSGGSGSSTTIEGGGSIMLDRTIWGKYDNGEDIDGHMVVNGDIHIKAIEDVEIEDPDDDDDDGTGEEIETDEGGGNLIVDLNTLTKTLEVQEDAYVKRHLYIDYLKDRHDHPESGKMCVCEIIKSIEDNLATEITRAKAAEKSNADAISAEVSRATGVEDVLDKNIQDCETGIRNNADEIAKLKNRTTQAETDIVNNALPIGSIIMFSGTIAEIPTGWAICNGENGTPNLIGKFIKAWTTSGVTGGSNSVMLSSSNLPEIKLHVDTEKVNDNSSWQKRLNKYVPTLDEVGEYVFDKGGSTHYTLYTGYNEGDKGLLGVKYTALFDDVADYMYVGEKNNVQTAITTEPEYYSLVYLMKVA